MHLAVKHINNLLSCERGDFLPALIGITMNCHHRSLPCSNRKKIPTADLLWGAMKRHSP